MKNITTTFLGTELKSPIILGACSLSNSVNKLQALEKAGIGAIIFRTLFEEQIQRESAELDEQLSLYDDRNAEMTSLFPKIEHAGPKEHIVSLKSAVDAVDIPVYASLNCLYDVTWVDYAKELAQTGIAGLELNFYDTPKKLERTAQEIEDFQVSIVAKVKKEVGLPIQVKLSRYYTNPLNYVKRLADAGADSVLLFNRLFFPNIDIQSEDFKLKWSYTNPEDKLYSLRFAGLLHGRVDASIVAGTGIYSSEDLIAAILAGADAGAVVSTIYKNSPEHVSKMIMDLYSWMDSKGYNSIDDFKGKLSYQAVKDKTEYTRAQYIDILINKKPDYIL